MTSEVTPNQALRFHADYDQYFDPDVYLRTHVNDVRSDVEKGLRQFVLDKLHAFCQRDDVTGATVLDLGCGPTITGVISAMNKFPDVYLSDISRPNRESLVKWLSAEPGHHDWSPFFKYILAKEGSSVAWKTRETELRSHIRGILPSDVTMVNCLSPCYFPPFDAIVSILCLDSAAKDVTDYRQNLNNLARLLKHGGWALIVDNLQESHYGVGTEKFICASLTLVEFQTAWQDAGFSIVDIETDRIENDGKEGTLNVALLARKL